MEQLKHECGVAMIRLLKPLDYYQQKYGTWMYGLNKLYLMMEKQHNRGQEGAGMACVNLDAVPGTEYMFRERAEGKDAITEIFAHAQSHFKGLTHEQLSDVSYAKQHLPFCGELYMGHLRYSTTGKSGLSYVHPFLRRNNWRAKNLCLCGNFNMTNIDEIFQKITDQGQCPRIYSDSYITLELMGHRLDREVERNFVEAKEQGLENTAITRYIEDNVKMSNVLKTTMTDFDGGYVMCGLTGSGEMFAVRDPWGIRPAFYYMNDEIIVLASERPVLQTTFGLECEDIVELPAGYALIVNKNGRSSVEEIIPRKGDAKCSFERIYFSRGSDRDIYQERKKLGEQLMQPIHDAINETCEFNVNARYSQSAYSALVLHSSVCAGYARAFQYLMQKSGIPCYYCMGTADNEVVAATGGTETSHSWNIVRTGISYCNVDVMWDDSVGDAYGRKQYPFFNLSDKDFKYHTRTGSSVNLPLCNDETQSYKVLFGDTVEVKDLIFKK